MMKSAPAASFIMAQTEFLLQFFVIPLDDPAMFGQAHQVLSSVAAGKVESQYLVGSRLFAGHSISNHCSACGSLRQ